MASRGIDGMEESGAAAVTTPRIRSAVLWRSGSQIIGQVVMWGSTLLVLRLLTPNDYGLFAMTQVVIGLVTLLNGYSFAASLVQSERLDRESIGQIFGVLILLNFGIAAAQFLLAPIAADYFHQPLLTKLLRVQCLLHCATPFIIMPQALLARDIDFRTQGRANIGAAAAGAITALSCAYAGLGVWTLVFAPIAAFTTRALLFGLLGRWWVRPRFRFKGTGAALGFGGTILVSDILWFIQNQADVFIAGRRIDAHMIGLYAEGLFLTQLLVNKFVPALNEVAFPAYARLQTNRGAVAWSFARATGIIMLAALPCYIGLAVTARPLVLTVMGPQWGEAAPLVRLLAFAMPFVTLHILYPAATNALGKPGVSARTTAAGAILLPIAFWIGVDHFGAMGLAGAWVAIMPVLVLISTCLSLPVIGLTWKQLGQSILPPLAAALAMGAVVLLASMALPPLPPAAELALLVPLGVAAYAVFALLLARPLVMQAWAMLRGRGVSPPEPQLPAI
ncbi:MAG TPA: lipopolysaccharide biosynthesis protein [Sphingomonas sp.]|nr:lipopolysaccharide biosynthesis protein [Sphingomonas sp.]